MWKIKLIFKNDNSRALSNFKDKRIDLELVGRGHYSEKRTFTIEICNDQLDKFYNFDNSASNTDHIK